MRNTRSQNKKKTADDDDDDVPIINLEDENSEKESKKQMTSKQRAKKKKKRDSDDESEEYIPLSESEDDKICIVPNDSKVSKSKNKKSDKKVVEVVSDSEGTYSNPIYLSDDDDEEILINSKRKRGRSKTIKNQTDNRKNKNKKKSTDNSKTTNNTKISHMIINPIDLDSFAYNNHIDEDIDTNAGSRLNKQSSQNVMNVVNVNTPDNSPQNNKYNSAPAKVTIINSTKKKKKIEKDDMAIDDNEDEDNNNNNEDFNNNNNGNNDNNDNEHTSILFSEKNLPSFMLPENIKDKQGRTPSEPDYDPATIYVPKKYLDEQTPAMRQYWKFKQDNYDKIVLFKIGRFYEMSFDDAIIGNRLFELNWMGSDPKKMHVAFPERSLDQKLEVFIEAGYTIALVEQIETQDQMKDRLKETAKRDDETIWMKRELSSVITRGTYLKLDSNYKNQYCITLIYNDKKENSNKVIEWGIMVFDVTTLNFYLGTIIEDPVNISNNNISNDEYSKFRALLYAIRPEEIIIQRNNIPQAAINFIHTLSSKPHISIVKNDYNIKKLNDIAIKYFGEDFDLWNQLIVSTITNEEKHYSECVALYVTIGYLENIVISKECLLTASFYQYNNNSIINPKKCLILDYQSAMNLEISETKMNPKNIEEGSLMEYMNQAKTPFGKRLLKNWILNPLYDVDKINERLDMVEDFISNEDLFNFLRQSLGKLPDLERQCSKFYRFASDSKQNVVHLEDIGKSRLHEFFDLIKNLSKTIEIFEALSVYIDNNSIKSNILRKKMTIGVNEGEVPNIKDALSDVSNNFYMVETKDFRNNPVTLIESKEGICPSFDKSKKRLEDAFAIFDEILIKERKRMKCAIINYTHTKGHYYELEIPEEYVKKKRPDDYIFTTKRKGYMRFQTKEIQKLVKDLQLYFRWHLGEKNKLNAVLFQLFHSKKSLINYYLNNIAELDSISALAYVSICGRDFKLTSCRPKFISIEERGNKPYIELRDCFHPCLSSRISHFVPNDIIIGNNDKILIVITGPNMGGKSTLLRSTCIAIIMAQIGCYAPASKCILTPVDRIFTRIGARDFLLEGKSTFYIEMEETKTILQHATINSMVIMDELGRGTSTHDGKLIAKTIIDRIEKELKCRTLFTTHYHDIIEWCKKQKGIDLFFMNCNIDHNTNDIAFEYKFTRGVCPESYGISIAKLAGLPQSIINMATEIAKLHKKQIKAN